MNRFWAGRVEAFDLLLVVFAVAAIAGTVTCAAVAVWLGPTQPVISGAVAMMAFVLLLALVGIGWLGFRGRTVPVALARQGIVLGPPGSRRLIPWTDVDRVVIDEVPGRRFVPVRVQLTDVASVLDDPLVERMFGGDGLALSRLGGLPAEKVDQVAAWAEHRFELVG
ncbi:MAG TPA: hypothetical protein VK020_06755 [Microlunatus sp.]|nr:hypothetical protein [Microlunatus sp.]